MSDDTNAATAPFQCLFSLGKRHLGHMDLDWFCKILVSLAVPPVQVNVPPTKLLAIMCSLKTSVPTFK